MRVKVRVRVRIVVNGKERGRLGEGVPQVLRVLRTCPAELSQNASFDWHVACSGVKSSASAVKHKAERLSQTKQGWGVATESYCRPCPVRLTGQ